jgi:hypothetical protein
MVVPRAALLTWLERSARPESREGLARFLPLPSRVQGGRCRTGTRVMSTSGKRNEDSDHAVGEAIDPANTSGLEDQVDAFHSLK